MARIRVRDNGPLVVEDDDVSICDADGTAFARSEGTVVLCRCGGSANKPFCDGTHRRIDFHAADRASG